MTGKRKDFGGVDHGDDQAALINSGNKPLTQIVQDDSFREFEFRQYLFACQSKLLFKLNRPFEVAARGYSFIISFSKSLAVHENILPFCMREVWVITACISIVNATASHYKEGLAAPDIEKEFYRLQGDLYSLCRVKFMRLAYLIGYGTNIERSPGNSASLSMLPWPKPGVWPSVPPDASSEVLAKEKIILQATPSIKHFGIQRKPLPLEPSLLLREANRRRASLSAGNMVEMFDGRQNFSDGSGSDASLKMPSLQKVQASVMSRTNSSPGISESSIDKPMRLAEIYVAAENALHNTVSNPVYGSLCHLQRSLRKQKYDVPSMKQKYLELTKGAADNYHRSWWKRHGVVLDGEIAAVCFKHGNFDLAAKSYEKVCALYADKGLFFTKERQAFQSEVVRLAHGEMEQPVPLDVSSLITFSGNPGPPLELCDGDPGTLSVTFWSGFPDDITLDSLSLTLNALFNTDEVAKALVSSTAIVLKPVGIPLPWIYPPKNQGGPEDSEDFMSYEKPPRPILKVFKPRPLVDLVAAVSSALLINEPQWVGIIARPINYSLKGAVLYVDTGPGLKIEDSNFIEMESYADTSKSSVGVADCNGTTPKDGSLAVDKIFEKLTFCDDRVEFPHWASNLTSIYGFHFVLPVKTLQEDHLQDPAVHFTDPFHVSTRVADKCNDGTLLLQVILHSEVKATLTIYDAWLDLQDGFVKYWTR
ncbi:trafficking protein particle complex II-specific subunit 130 homolog [Prunus yedoensis var. nudiflora]|uniref:Trafficking protein particle complex II-specific subunit 130 homolog n=1 Tax=Prunus yedoensis var. nudiflora TaxID=2094558 RepID=A0A314US28_PRUYE|nr:trafficking protein particle complex II-specific subunit 130 homolog [Prunus yedoensis var. nudiflora]